MRFKRLLRLSACGACCSIVVARTGSCHTRRFVALQGAENFRDIGGYRTSDGQMLKRGIFYRSDALSSLTDNDIDVLAALELHSVIDIRGEREVTAAPDRLDAAGTIMTDSYSFTAH